MQRFEAIPSLPPGERMGALFNQAVAARALLERAWDHSTAFQGIELLPTDTPSRGQCGVSGLWYSSFLVDQSVNARLVEGKIYVANKAGDDHVWVEVDGIADEPLVVDLTSDQYQTVFGTKVHVGTYADSTATVGRYTPEASFHPYNVPMRKLLARYALLEENITQVPKRYHLQISGKRSQIF